MKLTELLYMVDMETIVWITEDPTDSEGIYFGTVGEMMLKDAKGYKVLEIYPVKNSAFKGIIGLTIIVKKEKEK